MAGETRFGEIPIGMTPVIHCVKNGDVAFLATPIGGRGHRGKTVVMVTTIIRDRDRIADQFGTREVQGTVK